MQPNPYQSMNYNIQQAYPQYGYNPYFQQTRMQQPQLHRQISREDSTHSLSSENLTVSPTVCVMGSMHRTPL